MPTPTENKPEEKAQKNTALLWIAVAGVIGLIFLAYLYRTFHTPSPPPSRPEAVMNVQSKEFYLTFQKGIDEVGDAKSFYKMAQDLMVGPETTLTTTMPPSIPENNSKYFKAAENYSRSMEHLKHVKQMMDNVETPALEESEKDCLNLFNQAVEKYLGSSEILNRYAKALYTGSDQKTEQGLITEARPKYEMAEQSMSEILMGGCKGEFFRFVRFSDETEKSAVYNAYKKFFAEKFDLYRSAIEMLFDYRPSNTTP